MGIRNSLSLNLQLFYFTLAYVDRKTLGSKVVGGHCTSSSYLEH